MKILVDKVNGYYNLRNIDAFMRAAPDGSYMMEVVKLKRGRTLNQNEYLWGCVYPILLDALLDAGWEFTSLEQVHEFFKRMIARERIVNYNTGEIIEIPNSTATMDTVQFSAYVDKLKEYANEFLGVVIPQPNKHWRNEIASK
jgi:hypothetical protein